MSKFLQNLNLIKMGDLCHNSYKPEVYTIFEFQGEFENVELFNGVFDPATLIMRFDEFYLQGKKVHRKMTLVKKDRTVEGGALRVIDHLYDIILFDTPPRYILD
ncbi:hypothetical protein PAEPH01_0691 [Pancytospora epiphaga]|nr:hypothetical protein PAEPH01_0691 [Pancytospora epiphaga]